MSKRKQQSQEYIARLKAFLIKKPRTGEELSAHMGTTLNCVTKYCRKMQGPEGRVFISGWYFCETSHRWKCLRSYGQQDDVPQPPAISESEAGQRYRSRLKQDPARLERIREAQRQYSKDRDQRNRRNAREREGRAEAKREQTDRELLYGRPDFAHIQPHVDPWARILHGGAAMLAGVAA